MPVREKAGIKKPVAEKKAAKQGGRGKQSKYTPPSKGAQEVQIAQRRYAALQLRKQGATYKQIAEQVAKMEGMPPAYSDAQAHRDVQAELTRWRMENQETVEDMIMMEKIRLDWAQSKLASLVTAGDMEGIDRFVKVSESRRRLFGLDKPLKIAPTTPDGKEKYENLTTEQLDAEILRLLAASGKEPGA